MLQQKYNWILNGCRSLQLRLISELRGLCCYVGKPDPWSLYSTTDPDPMACDPSSRRCDSWSHPIFLPLIPDPIYLVTTLSIYKMRLTEEKRYKNFHLRLFLAEMRLNVLGMCNRMEEERRRQTLCDKFSLKKLFLKEINGFMLNVSFFKRPENINVKFTTNSQLIALSHLSHTSVLPLLEGKCRFHWVFEFISRHVDYKIIK